MQARGCVQWPTNAGLTDSERVFTGLPPMTMTAAPSAAANPVPADQWFDAIQGLRGVAMTLIFLHHAGVQLRPFVQAWWVHFLVDIGPLGTDLFFALAGAFTFRSLARTPSGPLSFAGKRFRRIYPVYLAVFGLYVALEVVFRTGRFPLPTDWDTASIYLQNLLLLPALFKRQPLLDVSWALNYIFAFYVAAPLLFAPVWRLHRQWRAPGVALLWMLAVAVLAGTGVGPLRVSLLLAGPVVWALGRTAIPNRIVAGAAVIGLCLRFGAGSDNWAFAGTALAIPSILALALRDRGWITRGLGWRPLAWLGYRSYSFYLCHGLAVIGVSVFVLKHLHGWQLPASLLPMWLGAVAITELVHRTVEVPFSLSRR